MPPLAQVLVVLTGAAFVYVLASHSLSEFWTTSRRSETSMHPHTSKNFTSSSPGAPSTHATVANGSTRFSFCVVSLIRAIIGSPAATCISGAGVGVENSFWHTSAILCVERHAVTSTQQICLKHFHPFPRRQHFVTQPPQVEPRTGGGGGRDESRCHDHAKVTTRMPLDRQTRMYCVWTDGIQLILPPRMYILYL